MMLSPKEKAKELIDKFLNFVREKDFFGDSEEIKNAKQCALIAEEFAIGFADWVIINYPNQKRFLLKKGDIKGFYTTKELLEIYKKKKGL